MFEREIERVFFKQWTFADRLRATQTSSEVSRVRAIPPSPSHSRHRRPVVCNPAPPFARSQTRLTLTRSLTDELATQVRDLRTTIATAENPKLRELSRSRCHLTPSGGLDPCASDEVIRPWG